MTEAAQGFGAKFEPLTVCLYEVDCDHIVDLRSEQERSGLEVSLEEMSCSWAMDLAEGREPASWDIARRFISDGRAGLIAPSFARGARTDMSNLTLWKWGASFTCGVTVHDPAYRLPRNQDSWKSDDQG